MNPTLRYRPKGAASVLFWATAIGFAIGLLVFLPTFVRDPTDAHVINRQKDLIIGGASAGFQIGFLLAALRALGLTNRKKSSETSPEDRE